MSSTRQPPRPPAGEGEASAHEGRTETRRAQLTPETPQPAPPERPAEAPPAPSPPPPEAPPREDPQPRPVPPTAHKEFPGTQYGTAEPVEPPPVKR